MLVRLRQQKDTFQDWEYYTNRCNHFDKDLSGLLSLEMKGLVYFSVLILVLIGLCQPALISVLRLRQDRIKESPIYQPSHFKLERWMQRFYNQVWESQCVENCAEGPKIVTEEMIQAYEAKIRYLQFRRRQPDLGRLLGI